ncbi:MAG: type I glutamate--ammonia ligase [Nanoarchaeota archaeon]|nr:type I glutamate--ammonia ligase [Nanoarchaeota archaeon]MBU1004999.1 type I glutamate--ammonia ligase [Nanoarchaeota archaeon]MBU1945891.1 type I glutamate--ammonia ligase [Nanoarchaeota archaeon]
MKNEEILKIAEEEKVKFVQLQFTDMHGTIKAVTIPVHKLKESLEKGTWFDGSSIEGFTRIAESDMFLKPDNSTYAVLPWEPENKKVARLICDVYTPDGKPFEGDPRHILKKVLKEASDMGFKYNVGPELEFFLFKPDENGKVRPIPHDGAGYFDYSPRYPSEIVRTDIITAIEALGLEVEASHHEVAPNQHEIGFKYGDALSQADKCVTFKLTAKTIAVKHGLHATFMPKPIFGENGSGMHVHQSLFDIKTGKNAFFDEGDKYKLSKTAKSFIAGQLKYIKGISAITAPTVNSYKRLVPGYEAPVYICWAQINRSALIRIPRYSPGREQATRAELRCPDPSSNPYLAFAAMLKAGLEGIKEKLEPPKPVEEDVYEFDKDKLQEHKIDTLPASLGEALSAFRESKIAKEVLGSHAFKVYLAAKEAEYDEYRLRVTEWEIDKYLETT